MSTRRERWLRTSAPAYHPEQSGFRRDYENAAQQLRLARWYRTHGDRPDAWDRMEADAIETLARMEAERFPVE